MKELEETLKNIQLKSIITNMKQKVFKNDLMLCNWVNYEQTRHVITGLLEETVLHKYFYAEEDDLYTSSYLSIKPIEITEELLEELGFKRWGSAKTYSLKSIILHKRKRGWVLRKSYKDFHYIHQIQNLITNL